MIKAIIFDMDGVIIDTHPVYLKADNDFFGQLGVKERAEEYSHLLSGRSLENGTQFMQDKYGFAGKLENLVNQRVEFVKKYYRGIKFIPGFLDFFNKIKGEYLTAVATSSNMELFKIADSELHLTELFNNRVYFLKDVNNVTKPAPDIFLYAAKMLGAKPSESLVIEDAINGIKAAKAAGIKCIAITTSHTAKLLEGADQVVNSFSEIIL